VWPSRSKPAGHTVLGVAGLAAIAAAVAVPVLAIGGVTLERLPQLKATGAAGAAAIGLFMASADESTADGCRAVPLQTVVASARAV
jgi:thiamine-phosphate pyrophosphorylase